MVPDPPPENSPDSIKIYHAKSGTQWRRALLAFLLGLAGLIPANQIYGWLAGGPRPDAGVFFAAAAAVLFLPIGAMCVANALRGLPRLTTTREGLTLEGGIRNKWASWESVGPFIVKNIYGGRFNKQVQIASAKIVGSDASRKRLRARTFAIADQFTSPISEIAIELNALRAWKTGDAAAAAAEIAPIESSIGLAQFRLPWLTFALLGVLIVVFALENIFPVTPSGIGLAPSIPTLVAFGAISGRLMFSYVEWYRLFTAPLLHGNLAHIIGNGVALAWGGWLLERLVGRLWFFAFFAVGALGGSLFSLAVNSANLVSVGASGALMALFAALFVGSFRHSPGTVARTRLQLSSVRILIPSLLPIASTSAVARIDYGAHIGGTLSGCALALVLLKYWPENKRIPQLRKAATIISAVGATLFVASGGLAIAKYPQFVQAVQHAQPALSSSTDVLSDHGPKRVACDYKWSRLQQRPPGDYREFLEKCMKDGST